jgi:hypothetical protein
LSIRFASGSAASSWASFAVSAANRFPGATGFRAGAGEIGVIYRVGGKAIVERCHIFRNIFAGCTAALDVKRGITNAECLILVGLRECGCLSCHRRPTRKFPRWFERLELCPQSLPFAHRLSFRHHGCDIGPAEFCCCRFTNSGLFERIDLFLG